MINIINFQLRNVHYITWERDELRVKTCNGTGKDGTLFLSPVKVVRYSEHTAWVLHQYALCELNMYSGWRNICFRKNAEVSSITDEHARMIVTIISFSIHWVRYLVDRWAHISLQDFLCWNYFWMNDGQQQKIHIMPY